MMVALRVALRVGMIRKLVAYHQKREGPFPRKGVALHFAYRPTALHSYNLTPLRTFPLTHLCQRRILPLNSAPRRTLAYTGLAAPAGASGPHRIVWEKEGG